MKKSKGIFFILILIIVSLMTSCVSSGTESESKDELELIVSEGLEFEMNEDGNSYSVVGFGTWQGLELVIPS